MRLFKICIFQDSTLTDLLQSLLIDFTDLFPVFDLADFKNGKSASDNIETILQLFPDLKPSWKRTGNSSHTECYACVCVDVCVRVAGCKRLHVRFKDKLRILRTSLRAFFYMIVFEISREILSYSTCRELVGAGRSRACDRTICCHCQYIDYIRLSGTTSRSSCNLHRWISYRTYH